MSTAKEFQKQIKFDEKAHPKLESDKDFPHFQREFMAVADAQGFADAIDNPFYINFPQDHRNNMEPR